MRYHAEILDEQDAGSTEPWSSVAECDTYEEAEVEIKKYLEIAKAHGWNIISWRITPYEY